MRTRLLLGLLPLILAMKVTVGDVFSGGALSSHEFVPFGESVVLNCSTPVPDRTSYDTRLHKKNTSRGPDWYAVEVAVDDWENSTAHCIYENVESPTIVMAYALPSNVTIDLETQMEEGKRYTINCTVSEVAPLEYLTINIYRGRDVIKGKVYDGPHVVGKETVSFSHTFTAHHSDNRMEFSCEAILRLTPKSQTVRSQKISAETYTLPQDPFITVEKWIEAGTEETAECRLHYALPQKHIYLEMFIDDAPIKTHHLQYWGKEAVIITNRLNETLGRKTIRCQARLLNLTRETAVVVFFYERPAVSLALSSDAVGLEENVTATCNVTNQHPEHYGLSIGVDGREEENVPVPVLTHTFTESRRTPSLTVICTAYIIGNMTINTSSMRILQVQYPPKFNESLCPSTMHLREGEAQFSCLADGNPRPTVECYANGHLINETVATRREMSGNYTCVATNHLGNDTKSGIVYLPPYEYGWIFIAIGVIVGLLLLAIIALICYCYWISGRKGFYQLLTGRRHGHQNGGLPSPPAPTNSTTSV